MRLFIKIKTNHYTLTFLDNSYYKSLQPYFFANLLWSTGEKEKSLLIKTDYSVHLLRECTSFENNFMFRVLYKPANNSQSLDKCRVNFSF